MMMPASSAVGPLEHAQPRPASGSHRRIAVAADRCVQRQRSSACPRRWSPRDRVGTTGCDRGPTVPRCRHRRRRRAPSRTACRRRRRGSGHPTGRCRARSRRSSRPSRAHGSTARRRACRHRRRSANGRNGRSRRAPDRHRRRRGSGVGVGQQRSERVPSGVAQPERELVGDVAHRELDQASGHRAPPDVSRERSGSPGATEKRHRETRSSVARSRRARRRSGS